MRGQTDGPEFADWTTLSNGVLTGTLLGQPVTMTGGVESAELAAGIFKIRQRNGGAPEFVVATAAEQARACAPGRPRPAKGIVRTLSIVAKGTFRTVPAKGIVTGRNASWTTVDRCNGTVTKVRRGHVSVKDGRRTIRVGAGDSYRIRARLFAARRAGA